MVNVNVRFPNLSQAPRTEVTYATLPFAQGEWDGVSSLVVKDEGGGMINAHIEPIGARWPDGSVRYAKLLVHIVYGPKQTRNLKVVDGTHPNPLPFVYHNAILSSVGNMLVKLRIKVNGQWYENPFINLHLIEDNRMRKVYRSKDRMGDFIADLKVYVSSRQQLIKFELAVTGSNPLTTAMNHSLEDMRLSVDGNCFMNIRGAARRGVSSIVPYKDFRLMSNDTFGNGQKQSWYGELFPFLDFSNMEQVGNALAALEYVVYGMSTDWSAKGAFTSLGAVQQPETASPNAHWTQLLSQLDQYYGFINSPGSPWDDYPLGLTKTPGQTGDQADFGCTEAGAMTYLGAAELLDMIYFMATEETKRHGHYYEANGSEVRSANHPNWVTWNSATHWHTGVSPDRLGKTAPNLGMETHGWESKDWEHHSSNLLSLASLMTGSYLLLDEVDHEMEMYIAGHTLPSMKPGWSTNGRFPPRAFGRTHHAMCNHYLLTGRQDLYTRMMARFNECILPFWDGATHSPVKNWEHIRDDRVLGSTVDAWVPWNDSLGFVGMVALYNTTRSQAVKDLLVQWGNTILNYGWHADFNGSTLTSLGLGGGVKWNADGSPLSEAEYYDPLKYFHAGGGLILWGVQVLEVIKNNPLVFGEQNANKAALYAQYVRSNHPTQPNVPFSEYGQWLAIRLMP